MHPLLYFFILLILPTLILAIIFFFYSQRSSSRIAFSDFFLLLFLPPLIMSGFFLIGHLFIFSNVSRLSYYNFTDLLFSWENLIFFTKSLLSTIVTLWLIKAYNKEKPVQSLYRAPSFRARLLALLIALWFLSFFILKLIESSTLYRRWTFIALLGFWFLPLGGLLLTINFSVIAEYKKNIIRSLILLSLYFIAILPFIFLHEFTQIALYQRLQILPRPFLFLDELIFLTLLHTSLCILMTITFERHLDVLKHALFQLLQTFKKSPSKESPLEEEDTEES